METLTKEELKNSPEFKKWVLANVVLIHNIHHGARIPQYEWIVIHSDDGDGLWSITRFFKVKGDIQVVGDHQDVRPEQIFKILLDEYSQGIE